MPFKLLCLNKSRMWFWEKGGVVVDIFGYGAVKQLRVVSIVTQVWRLMLKGRVTAWIHTVIVAVVVRFYAALFSALEQTHCTCMWFFMSNQLLIARFWIFTEVVYLQHCLIVTWLVPRETAAISVCSVYRESSSSEYYVHVIWIPTWPTAKPDQHDQLCVLNMGRWG